jgi:two-component system, NarL family, nitrate/nitrite response regulator NarL
MHLSGRRATMPISGELLRVLVVSDHPYARVGIVNTLAGQVSLSVVGESASDISFIELADLYAPSVIVWEIPYESPHAPLRLAELRDIKVPTLVLLHDEQRTAEIIAGGARGVLNPNADADTIAIALAALSINLVVVDSGIPLIARSTPSSPVPPLEILTSRELEVLRLVAEGLPNKQIALRLNISEHTIKFHINAIMGKLGVQSRTEAVVRATRQGLIAL